MKIKLESSKSLLELPKNELWLPSQSHSKISNLDRRKFLKLVVLGSTGLGASLAINALTPKEAEAGWWNLIPVFLAGMTIIEKSIHWGNQLSMKLALRNTNDNQYQQGNIGIRLVSYEDRPIYNDRAFVDNIPPMTERIYTFEGFPSGNRGQNFAYAQTRINQLQQPYYVT